MGEVSTGALAGWKRSDSASGIVLTLQLAPSEKAFGERDFHKVNLAMNDRQLRSLARDLARAAEERGLDLHAERGLFRRWLGSGG